MIIIIHGPPAVGKTTLAKALAKTLNFPLLSTDGIAEHLYDSFEENVNENEFHIREAAYELLFKLIEDFTVCNNLDLVVESVLNPEGAGDRLKKIFAEHNNQEVVEVFLNCEPEVLVKRYRERLDLAERHRVHDDRGRAEKLKEHLNECDYRPIFIGHQLIEIDSSQSSQDVLKAVLGGLRTV